MTGPSNLFSLNDQATPITQFNDANIPFSAPETPKAFLSEHRCDFGRKFSSLNPNHEFLYALTEGINTAAYEEAEAIVEAYRPAPWKGQIWYKHTSHDRVWTGPLNEDLVWTGSDWKPVEQSKAPVVPLIASTQPVASVALTNTFRVVDGDAPAIRVSPEDLNAAYERFEADPDQERGNLWVTIASFVRSREKLAQCWKLIVTNPEIALEVDDIFADFIISLHHRMTTQYAHLGKLDHWINAIWGRYFFPGVEKDVIEYLKETRFVNNVDPSEENSGYKFEKHCVRTDTLASSGDESLDRGFRAITMPLVGSPFTAFTADHRDILGRTLQGETEAETAVRLDVTPRHARRLLKAAKEEAKRILGGDEKDSSVTPDEGAELILDLHACAESWPRPHHPENRLADIVEAHQKALTVPQLAQILNISKREVYRLVADNRLPALKIGTLIRLDPSVTAEWIRERMTMAA